MRQDDVICDVTLLVGPQKTPIRPHRLVLAATFEYFKVLFALALQESKQDEVHLSFIKPEDMTRLLDFAYKARTPVTQKTSTNL